MLVNEITSSVAVMADGIILSRAFDMYSVAAHGLCTPYTNAVKFITCFFATGTQVSCSRAVAAGRLEKANRIFTVSSVIAVIISVSIAVLITIFASPIAAVLGANSDAEHLLVPTTDYLRGLAVGLPVTLGTSFLISIVTLNNDKPRVARAVSTMMTTNVIGDLLNVFLFKGGMFGMAFATTASYMCSFVILLAHFRTKNGLHLDFSEFSLSHFKEVAVIGFLPMVTRMFSMIRAYLVNIIFTTYASTAALAANTLVRGNIKVLLICFANAIGSATLTVAGLLYGEKDIRGIRQMFRTVLFLCFGVCTVLAAVIYLLAPQITALFGAGEHIELAVIALRFFTIGFPIIALKMFYIYYFQASLNKKLSLYSSITGEMVFITATCFVMGRMFGTIGLFCAYPVSEMLYIVSLILIMCVKGKSFPHSIDDFLFIREDFGIPDEDKIDISVETMEAVVRVSDEAYHFCKAHGLSDKQCYMTSLAVEEMAGNIVEHGFSDKQKKQFIDIKIAITDGDILIRLRDNCRPFDPVERAKIFDPDDPMKNIGLRMMVKVVKHIDYSNVLGLNNLIIRV